MKAGDLVQDENGNVFVVGADGMPVPVSSDQLADLTGGNTQTETGGTSGGQTIGGTPTQPIYIPNSYGQQTGQGSQGTQYLPPQNQNSQINNYWDLFGGNSEPSGYVY
jgi:hypothetical protein